MLLSIKNLSVSLDGKELLKDINLDIAANARHLLYGQNGSGKTSLVQTIAGNPDYRTTAGKIIFEKHNFTDMAADERARKGLFLGAQHVPEIPGLSVTSFLKHSMAAHYPKLTAGEFFKKLATARDRISIPESWLTRSINTGFSGGERKRLMFMHLILVRPKLAILDEPDSGVDNDTQKLFAEIIAEMNQNGTAFLVISHQEKFTKIFNPTATTTLSGGKIVV
ncbi:MAG: Fe-S cluster assembly ATPase SufC [Alphaproteobacteria bacterium]|nr:Fe-S cluster assembly ATPase SufC [Alphaproteobacteria bacterium]